ncbi:cell division protein FtsZ [Chryseobacterium indologenes]|uniref:Cell division protein FtsZ n=1 Tax=Chryseobacterium indologenes TaxID=253 RepID=A0AAD1DVK5_CHRID|nr:MULTISPECIES: cell division protein FtsZ [Chryseobacterium]ATN07111.1 cell division protein FtsZ [Chryseobacterium indologenes]AYY84141.1 cell division protein FtsZ [Chryseobacterium indologenes]AYZ37888.1 cell division protein FtsZ [Chryseobacterium indologenes]AZB18910.1 cell division protein FtsZ [Chryseobacterium indologenes]MBF6646801.1 cell division protein FtsZ [Chryseobacterium indologenes]
MENIGTQGFSFDLPKGNSSIIKVIGVGGGGNNALKHMYEKGIHGVDFVICNTDAQTLDNNPVANKVQLGTSITEGLGAGADPEVGEKSAIESIEDIKAAMGQNTKMVFITAGMGGGTGTGAAPVIAKVAKDMGILTVGIVTVPFSFEGKRRLEQAENGLDKLKNNVDSLIVINNDKLRQQFGNLGFKQGFSKADEVLANAAKGMAEVITGYFDVNIDFRDAKSVLQNSGTALMSTGTASGENKAEEAVRKALDSPLLNDNKITGAKNVLLLIRSGAEEVTMDEIGIIMDHIQKEAGNTADIIFGVGADEELGDAVSVLVIATGFSNENKKFAGPTEKIRISLNDSFDAPKNSPFKTREEREATPETPIDSSRSNHFRLDDEDHDTPQFNTVSVEKKMIIEEEEIKTEIKFFDKEDDTSNAPEQAWRNEEETEQEYSLFSIDEEGEDPNDLEIQSFSFDFENKKEEPQSGTPVSKSFSEEKPVEFNFFVNEPTRNESKSDFGQPKAEFNAPASAVAEPAQKMETFYQKQEEPKAEVKPAFETKKEIETPKTEESEFTFVNKTVDQDRVVERRNKLKEFNSRYQSFDSMSEFESIPAFKRKNISIDGTNASDQNINTYLSDNNGSMQIRENRFLNKDVD